MCPSTNKSLVLKDCRIIGRTAVREPADILIQDGKIAGIGQFSGRNEQRMQGHYVCAGFVDIHCHGGYGSDFMDATAEAFDNITRYQFDHGTTSVVATSLTAKQSDILRFLDCTRSYMNAPPKYAQVMGVHLEGPFLSAKGCGAQNSMYLMDPLQNDYQFILANRDIIRTVTIAPELDIDGSMTRALTESGITVCGGHDDGAYPEFIPAVHAGLKHLTHIYCAMSGFGTKNGVRQMGLREYGLWNDSLTCEMIADNVHITPEMAKFILKCKGPENVAVVSDALRCAGMPNDDRLYTLGTESDLHSQKIRVADGIAVLADGSKFAGSITSVHEMVKNLISAGVGTADAFQMGTATPARIIGEKDIGCVEVGFRANLCELDDSFDILSVYRDGIRVS